jgi:hypothetical protein
MKACDSRYYTQIMLSVLNVNRLCTSVISAHLHFVFLLARTVSLQYSVADPDPGSEIRDPGSGMGKNQDPGSGINIPDPQHCFNTCLK